MLTSERLFQLVATPPSQDNWTFTESNDYPQKTKTFLQHRYKKYASVTARTAPLCSISTCFTRVAPSASRKAIARLLSHGKAQDPLDFFKTVDPQLWYYFTDLHMINDWTKPDRNVWRCPSWYFSPSFSRTRYEKRLINLSILGARKNPSVGGGNYAPDKTTTSPQPNLGGL